MNNRHRLPSQRGQQGAALIVVLILLLVMTLVGLASLRGTIMEERMSANMYDRSLAFQSAEAALRLAEQRLLAPGIRGQFPTTGAACAAGLCPTPNPATAPVPRAEDPAFAGWVAAANVEGTLAGTPQYFIEYMGMAPGWALCDRQRPRHPACMRPRYRITARSEPIDGRAQVMLQSNFAGS